VGKNGEGAIWAMVVSNLRDRASRGGYWKKVESATFKGVKNWLTLLSIKAEERKSQ